jgi:hypothetical protein
LINFYGDDSSDGKRERFVSCGGIVGEELLVSCFEGFWKEQTKHLEKPFRSTECECQQGQFKTWSIPACTALMTRLVDVLCSKHNLVGAFASVVPVADYKQVFAGCDGEDAFRLAVAHTIVEMARLGKRVGEHIKLWFEDSDRDHAMIDRTYREFKSLSSWAMDERGMLYGVSFDDKSLAPLQAADLVAREGFKAADNRGKRNVRKPMLRLWDTSGVVIWGDKELEMLKANGWPEDPSALIRLPDSCFMTYRKNDGSHLFTIQE